jgi:[methyl-Co(III) methanol-specific corrinoid protein]:coenzyme M methyltransferase
MLSKQQLKSVPFICPGGIISKAALGAAGKPASYWHDVYLNADKLYQLAKALHDYGGTDNYAVPLCLTAEAEMFGAQVNYHPAACELRIRGYPFSSLETLVEHQQKNSRRQELVLEVVRQLKAEANNTLIVGNVTGPLTLLTQLVEPNIVLKAIPHCQGLVHQVLQRLTSAIEEYGLAQIEAGAGALTINEPTANGEILGPGFFAQFCVPYLRKLLKSFAQHLPKTILHICGRIDNLLTEFRWLPFWGLSVDSTADIKRLKQGLKDKVIFGSICTHALATRKPAQITALSQQVINQGADALCLPCGLIPTTPLENIRAMARAAEGGP